VLSENEVGAVSWRVFNRRLVLSENEVGAEMGMAIWRGLTTGAEAQRWGWKVGEV